jgi:cold shock CspA family protein
MEQSPSCRIYYATTGTWTQEQVLQARADQGVSDLEGTHLFSSVSFVPIDVEALKRLYRELKQKIVREFVFEKHTIVPQISGVQEAYIGIVPCPEYLKLVCDDDGALNRRLFFDNVRDFQGHNPVNSEIEATVNDATRSDRFALLNNGVTVVARDVNKVGARFRLSDYQIVNGCQTTHILYQNRAKLTPSTFLPLKLIVTTDADVTNQVIQGTNRQTEVKLEAFESLAPFQKKLEELYVAMGRGRGEPLYYERRSKQYEHLEIRRERIISLAVQVKCFLAMFLNEPHSTHRYYGELLSAYRNRLFGESHSATPYYVSGLALATLERLFLNGRLPRTWRLDKYQLLMVHRLQNEAADLPALNSKALEKYCDALLARLDDSAIVEEDFRRAGELVERVRRQLSPAREPLERTRAFTEALTKAAVRPGHTGLVKTEQETGTVKRFSDIRGYGFIGRDAGGDAFVHYSAISGAGYRSLSDGQRVRFAVVDTPRGVQAVDVETI